MTKEHIDKIIDNITALLMIALGFAALILSGIN
jgi:hypothetical protein